MRTKTGMACVLALCATLVASNGRADDASDVAEARKQFAAGVNLLDDPDGAKYEDAYHAFKKAYALSKNVKVLGNIGFCAMHLERDGEAIEAYSTYLRETADIDERERTQIQRDLATMTSTVARVRITVKHPGSSFQLVDTRLQTRGSAIENTYPMDAREIAIRVRPGRHTFKAKAGNQESVVVEALVEPASDGAYEITFPPPRAATPLIVRESPSYAGPIILGVAGLVAIGGGVATGLLARSKQSDIESNCPNDLCPTPYDLDGERDKAKTYGTIADSAFIAGGVLVAGSLLWYLLVPKGRSSSTGATTASAMCTGTGCGFTIGRGF